MDLNPFFLVLNGTLNGILIVKRHFYLYFSSSFFCHQEDDE